MTTDMKAADAREAVVIVLGMRSGHCVGIVRAALENTPGLSSVEIDIACHRVSLGSDHEQVDRQRLRAAVKGAGHEVPQVEAGDAGAA